MKNHPNKEPFKGVLGYVDIPSDRTPSGARGHRVILTRTAAEEAIPSLFGMGINAGPYFNTHAPRGIVGVITGARIKDNEILVRGYIFGYNYPELLHLFKRAPDEYGMSYELKDAHVEDMRATIWRLSKVTFIGASIINKSNCAYAKSSFHLCNKTRVNIAASSDSFSTDLK